MPEQRAGLRVLVVEDEALIAEEIQDRLRRLGHSVVGHADNGADAVRIAESERPQVVLMDIRLRGASDGIAAANEIYSRFNLPVVFLTAHSDQATVERAKAVGPFGYVLKPFNERELLIAVEMAVQRHEAERRLVETGRLTYAAILEALDVAVLACDPDGTIRYLNPAAAAMVGWPAAEATGKTLPEVVALRHEDGEPAAVAAPPAGPLALTGRGGAVTLVEARSIELKDGESGVIGRTLLLHDVGERRRSERALEDSESRFKHLTAISTDWYWEQDAQFRFTFVSSSNGDLAGDSGISINNYLGRTRWDVPCANMSEADWARHRAQIERHEPFRDLVLRRPDADGKPVWVSISGDPIFDADGAFTGYRGTGRNISERIRLAQSLSDARAQVELLLDSVPAAIVHFDRDERIVAFNRGFAEMIEQPAERLKGMLLREAVDEATYAVAKPYLERTFAGEALGYERRRARRQGAPIDIYAAFVPHFADDGTIGGAFAILTDVTLLKDAQRASQASERRFRDFARASSDFFWEADVENHFTWISDPGTAELWQDSIEEQTWRILKDLMENRSPFRNFRYSRETPNGTRWIAVSGIPVYDRDGKFTGYRGVSSDVTVQVQSEQRAREADERLRGAVENLDAGFLLWDKDDRLLLWNQFLSERTPGHEGLRIGMSAEELLGEIAASGAVPEAVGREDAWVRERLALRRASFQQSEVRLGSQHAVVSSKRIPDGSLVTLIFDISDRRAAEDEIAALNATLERRVIERTAELEASNAELQSFSYSVSHDLRAPLRAIDGMGTLLLEDYGDTLDAKARDYLSRLRAQTHHMGRLIDDLLKLAHVSQEELRIQRLDLSAMAKAVAKRVAGANPGAAVKFVCAPGLKAYGDPTLIDLALYNLMENAWKFSSKTLHSVVEFGAANTPDGTAFFVRDNGVGFDMKYADKLFGPFQRVHSKDEYPGTGVGLATVDRVMRRHGGCIWADSVPGMRTDFYFRLPLSKPRPAESARNSK